MKPQVICASFAAVLAIAGTLAPSAALAEVGEFTGSEGRTIKFRYEMKAGWSPDVPRGVHIYFHGNNAGTQDDMLRGVFLNRDLGWKLNLVLVTVASPEAIPPDELEWQRYTDHPYTGHGTRFWAQEDEKLLHELLQSEFGRRFRIDFDRVVFNGGSAGTCFLHNFVRNYGKFYGGGLLANCGCFRKQAINRRATWNPPDEFRRKFRVFVRSTKEDFLYQASLSAYGYYKYVVGFDSRGDLEAGGGHCSPGNVTDERAVEWLLNGTGLPEEPAAPHFKRVSGMVGLVGVTVDGDGALWAARQAEGDSQAVILRSVDRGESLEAVARVGLDVHDIDAIGSALVATVNEGGVQSLYQSSNHGKDFHKLDLDGGRIFSNTITDIHDNLYAVAPKSSGRQEAWVSSDQGRSWMPLGAPENSFYFANPDPIQTVTQSAFLMLTGYPSQRIGWLGATTGNDWSPVSSITDGLEGGVVLIGVGRHHLFWLAARDVLW